jgi:hypothetical protein
MQIFTIDQHLIDRGRVAFHLAALQFMCGPNSSVYTAGRRRLGGLAVVPGAVVAAIEMGLNTTEEIVPAVARATRCWPSTITAVLEGLGKDGVPDRLWASNANGTFRLIDHAAITPFTVMTS